MNEQSYESAIREEVLVRLDTLIRLRWYAIVGQVGAVLVIAFGLGYPMPWEFCLVLIAASTALNLMLAQKYRVSHRLSGSGAFALLGFDVLQLAVLLFLTGGLQNPFSILLMAPVVVSSTSLRLTHTLLLGLLAVASITALAFFHLPLPWDPAQPLKLPPVFIAGIWVAVICTLAFTAIYAFRVAEEARKLANALAATELVLQREQHLSALDGLAAAAAHELGTPLATIALVSKEMLHALPEDNPMHDDAVLLRSQAQRCRDILQKLTSLSSEGEAIITEQSISAMVEEEAAPLRNFGVDIRTHFIGKNKFEPTMNRSPGVHYGLGNLIDNAVEFARNSVAIIVDWDADSVRIEISDDGPGFPPAILTRLGEPFLTSRSKKKVAGKRGLGLGLFIAKTLLERSGAELSFSNHSTTPLHNTGAFVRVTWKRERLEREVADAQVSHQAEPAV